MTSSDLHGFYKKERSERIEALCEAAGLAKEDAELLEKNCIMDFETADSMIENVVATQQLPLGIATNFKINGIDRLVPMAVEEPSVVAAASNAAGIVRKSGGFEAKAEDPIMIGQIMLVKIDDAEKAKNAVLGKKEELIEAANSADPILVKFGGGAKDIEVRTLEIESGKVLLVHLLVDVRDAMGANAVNTMTETIAPILEEATGGKARLRIITNLAINRKVKAKAVFSKQAIEESFKGKDIGMNAGEIVDAILEVYELAAVDQFRATTHNKGIMNGIDAVAVATGQDWRAIEAGAHSFAAFGHNYAPLTKYSKNENGDIVGEIELPIAVGLVGGAVKTSPLAGVCIRLLGIKKAQELSEVMAAVGLAQNFAAMREIGTRGIQAGHMALHAKNIAVIAGAQGKVAEEIAKKMIEEKKIRVDRAKELLEAMK